MSSRAKKKRQQRQIVTQVHVDNDRKDYNFVIGIISYLPDDLELKKIRINRLNALFQQCDKLLNLPIIIIAQNWNGISLKEGTIRQSITIHQYPKLGITGARKKLREKFLESNYDYLIMLDDDSQLVGDENDATVYLNTILAHPNMFCEYKPMLLKLFAISKYMYNLIDLPDGGADSPIPEKRFFEDMMIIKTLQKLYPEREFKIPVKSFMEVSDAAWDQYNSGWHKEVYSDPSKWDRHNTGDITRALVKHVTKGNDGKIVWTWPDYVEPNTKW